jgi:maltose alpha-D-glucosyltransferase/alpha-amylase
LPDRPDKRSGELDFAAVRSAVGAIDPDSIEKARWFAAKGRAVTRVELDHAFVLDPTGPHVLAIASTALDPGPDQRYTFALTGEPLRAAEPGDGAWEAVAARMHRGAVVASIPVDGGDAAGSHDTRPTAALVCRPGPAMPSATPGSERALGADQSNTSVVLDAGSHSIILKSYRRLQPGLNPDLEMTAFLSEQAGFAAVPPVAGFCELVEAAHGTSTVAMAQAFIDDGEDAFESIAETLTAWLLAPGEVSLEYATEVASDLGTLTAGLHAAVADPGGHGLPDMAPRPATRSEVRGWASEADAHFQRALDVAPAGDEAGDVIRRSAARIAEVLGMLRAVPAVPDVIRAHGDYHLGQVLIAPDGYRIIDFEGEPLSTPDERRAHRHPLRDVASMLRSLDHVGRSSGRRAVARNGGPLDHVGLDLSEWLRRSRERFLEAYRVGLLEARVMPAVDEDLLLAFEVDKELYEFAYAATYLPSWLWAPTEGLRGLLAGSVA